MKAEVARTKLARMFRVAINATIHKASKLNRH
jgi:hypothetical protein